MEMLLLKQGEVVLKGLNRSKFENAMLRSLRQHLEPYGAFGITSQQSTVYAIPQSDDCDMDGATVAAGRVFGFVNYSRAMMADKDIDAIAEAAYRLPGLADVSRFKVEARRADKSFPMTSPQICEEIGYRLLERYSNLSVDVHRPEQIVWVEIRREHAFVHLRPLPGAGGLPDGTGGEAVLLLSGGIDSPVAGWRMARRGLTLHPLHFYSYPYTSPEARDKVLELARLLSAWTGPLKVRVVPYTAVQEALRRHMPEPLLTVLMRRSMCRIAQQLADRLGAAALVTGDSLGQVASQTLPALAATQQAVQLPILRPLVGMDKDEVVRAAREIGTFDTSILPYEDCCSVFTPKHPDTKPRLEAVRAAEARFDLAPLEAEALEGIECLEVSYRR